MEGADWACLSSDLIIDVLRKIQGSAESEGDGRRIVALAGVCRSWRRSVQQEMHLHPPALLCFSSAVRQPAPSGSYLQCMLRKTGDTFQLVQVVRGKEYFLLGARKNYALGSTYFKISTDHRILWTQGHDVIIMTSNFWRTSFVLKDSGPKNESTSNLSVQFEEVAIDRNCMRKMRCHLGPPASYDSTSLDTSKGSTHKWWRTWWSGFFRSNHLLNPVTPTNFSPKTSKTSTSFSPRGTKSRHRSSTTDSSTPSSSDTILSLTSKTPVWNEQLQCWSLDFNGRASIVASINNFQLVSTDSNDARLILQLGKLCKGLFAVDFCAPLSPLQAMAIVLPSFATAVGIDP